MMELRWIPGTDDQTWMRTVSAYPDADIYHDLTYARAAALGNEVVLVEATSGTARLALTLALKPIPACGGYLDAESPYGYAGPLCLGDVTGLWPAVLAALAERLVINVFLRLSPMATVSLPHGCWRSPPQMTACIPLADGLESAFAGGRCAGHRSQVARGQRAGLRATTRSAPSMADLQRFRLLYDTTMQALNADGSYYFSDAYYQLVTRLGDRLSAVEVVDAHDVIHAAALFMRGAHWAHYHLSGRLQGGHNAAGDLLLHAGAAWAAENRCSLLHLGGGHSSAADDPLLAFKRRIGRADTTAAFAGIVCLPAVHARLTSAWEAAAGRQARWFQGYREPHRGVPDGQ
jgi:hypothetical protein